MYGRALRIVRNYHRLSQTEVAARLGLSKSYISEIESGVKKVTLEVLERYADEFGIPMSSLILFAERTEKPPASERARIFAAGKVLKMLEWVHDTAYKDSHHR